MRRADRICLSCRYQTVGQSEEAAYEFENAISLMPANPTSYFMAGLHLNAKQQWQAEGEPQRRVHHEGVIRVLHELFVEPASAREYIFSRW